MRLRAIPSCFVLIALFTFVPIASGVLPFIQIHESPRDWFGFSGAGGGKAAVQEHVAKGDPMTAAEAAKAAASRGESAVETGEGNAPLEQFLLDPEIRSEHKKWLTAKYEDERQKIKQSQNVVYWSNVMSVVITIVVHVLLGLAVWAAIREYSQASMARRTRPQQQELQISADGIALKTSLHATLLLLIAIGFYFLYLKFVYPVTALHT